MYKCVVHISLCSTPEREIEIVKDRSWEEKTGGVRVGEVIGHVEMK